MDWLDLLAVQGTHKSLLQHHGSKASILWHSAFFTVQLSHPYMTTGKTIALTRWTFVGKVMSLLFNILSRLVITFLPRSKRLLISWLQSPSVVILGAKLQLKWTDEGGNLEGERKEQALRIRPAYLQSWLHCYYHCSVLNLSYLTRNWVIYIGNGKPLQYSCLENPMDRGA